MANTVADISIQIGADISGLLRETDRAAGKMSDFEKRMGAMSARIGKVGTAMTAWGKRMSVVTGAVTVAAGAALAFTNNAADLGDAIDNASRAAGMSAEAFQEYRFAIGEAADMTNEEFADAMVKMTKQLGEAQAGSKSAIAAFEAIGISAEQIAAGSVDGEQALAALVKTLEATNDPATAAALATDVLGKNGARMGALLAGSTGQVDELRATAQAMGLVMSGDAVKASASFKDEMGRLSAQFDAVKMALADRLMPVLTDTVIPFLQDHVIPAILSVIDTVGGWIDVFQDLPEPVKEGVMAVVGLFAVGGPLLVALGIAGSVIGALVTTGPIGLLIAAAGLAYVAWQKWGDDIKLVIGAAVDWVSEKFNAFLAKIDGIIAKLKAWKDAAAEFLSITPMTPQYDDPNAENPGLPGTLGGGDGSMNIGGGAGNDMLGASIADGMVNGLQLRLAERMPEIVAAVDSIPAAARAALGIQSPSTVFAEIGGYIGEGLANGISGSAAMVNGAVNAIGAGATATAQGTVQSVLQSMNTLFSGSKKIALALAAVNVGVGLSEALKLPFPANLAAVAKVAAEGSRILGGIRSAQPGGSGGGGRTGGGGSNAAAAAVAPQQFANITLVGNSFSADSVEKTFEIINQGLKQGRVLNVVRA